MQLLSFKLTPQSLWFTSLRQLAWWHSTCSQPIYSFVICNVWIRQVEDDFDYHRVDRTQLTPAGQFLTWLFYKILLTWSLLFSVVIIIPRLYSESEQPPSGLMWACSKLTVRSSGGMISKIASWLTPLGPFWDHWESNIISIRLNKNKEWDFFCTHAQIQLFL